MPTTTPSRSAIQRSEWPSRSSHTHRRTSLSVNGTGAGPLVTAGGTLTIQEDSTPDHWDPQRIYTGEDLAMMGTFLFRSLTQYKPVSGAQGNEIQGDIATNTGVPTNLAKTWTFTLKSGVTFQDGTAVTCADVKYAVSRVFAQDTITDGPAYPLTMLATSYTKYFGPYVAQTAASTAALDAGIWCGTPANQKAKKQYPTGNVITFNLVRSVADFNYSTTLLSYAPVQKSKDSGEGYDRAPQATRGGRAQLAAARHLVEFLRIEVLPGAECGLDDHIPLLGAAEPFPGKEGLELLADGCGHESRSFQVNGPWSSGRMLPACHAENIRSAAGH